MMGEPTFYYVDCPKCQGTGVSGIDWDEDTRRSVAYVCGACSGSGALRVWDDE